MSACKCGGTGTILVEGPCDAAPLEAPCVCMPGCAVVPGHPGVFRYETDGYGPAYADQGGYLTREEAAARGLPAE